MRRCSPLVLGLGLGMVMQVLVLAVQNAVDYSVLGVATSGSTLFRQVGGSIGVALFGTIFANRLGSRAREPAAGGSQAAEDDRAHDTIGQLPPAVHAAFADAFAAALQPVFLMAAAISVLAFALAWLLHEVPLRTGTHATDAIPPPRDPRSAAEAAGSPT